MCWYRRRRDRPFLDCLAELEAPIARVTSRSARSIVVAGMSQGGIAALAFGARRPGLVGIIALAPAGAPERQVTVFPQITQSVAQARAMVAGGHGDEHYSFNDLNIRGSFPVNTTATIYLSFFDPTGPANMFDNTSRLREPLLWVAGTGTAIAPDRRTRTFCIPSAPPQLGRQVMPTLRSLPKGRCEVSVGWIADIPGAL
jgi:pimeloyl-ACP methyl ester carboxylesterase